MKVRIKFEHKIIIALILFNFIVTFCAVVVNLKFVELQTIQNMQIDSNYKMILYFERRLELE